MLSDNDDGITVVDVTAPDSPQYCLAMVSDNGFDAPVGIPFSISQYGVLYREPEEIIALCEDSLRDYSLLPPKTLIETWGGPFRRPHEGEFGTTASQGASPIPQALALPAYSQASTIPSLQSLSLEVAAEQLVFADDDVVREWWGALKPGELESRGLPFMILEVLRIRFTESVSCSILDFSGLKLKPSNVRLLLQLLAPKAQNTVSYLDLSNTRLAGNEAFSTADLVSISGLLPSLRCVNLIGSELFPPLAISNFYSLKEGSSTAESAPIPRVALLYKNIPPPKDGDEQFASLIGSALPLALEPPQFSLLVRTHTHQGWCCPSKSVHYSATSIPFFQLDSVLEAVAHVLRFVTSDMLSDSNAGILPAVMQQALSSLGPGLHSLKEVPRFEYQRRPLDSGFQDATGEIEDEFNDVIRVFPATVSQPACLTGIVAVIDVGPEVYDKATLKQHREHSVQFGLVDLGREAPPLISKAAPSNPDGWWRKFGDHLDETKEEEEAFSKEVHTPYKPITLDQFIERMVPLANEGHKPNTQLLENVRAFAKMTVPFTAEEMTLFVAKMRNYRQLDKDRDAGLCRFS